jgi:hypothetical protein
MLPLRGMVELNGGKGNENSDRVTFAVHLHSFESRQNAHLF